MIIWGGVGFGPRPADLTTTQVFQQMFCNTLDDMANFGNTHTLDSMIQETPYTLAGEVATLNCFAQQIGGPLAADTQSLLSELESWIPIFNNTSDINSLDTQPKYIEAMTQIGNLAQNCIDDVQNLTTNNVTVTQTQYNNGLVNALNQLMANINNNGYGQNMGSNSIGTLFGQSNAFAIAGMIDALEANPVISQMPGMGPDSSGATMADNAESWASNWSAAGPFPGSEPQGLSSYNALTAQISEFITNLEKTNPNMAQNISELNPPPAPNPSDFPITS